MGLRILISSSIVTIFSKNSILILFTGFSPWIIPLTPEHNPFVVITFSLLFRINNLLLFLIKDV